MHPFTTNGLLSPVVWARSCCGRPMMWEVYLAAYVCSVCNKRA